MTSDRIKNRHCPDCLGVAYITDWVPPYGIDPTMRQFRCDCGFEFYTTIKRPTPLITGSDGLYCHEESIP